MIWKLIGGVLGGLLSKVVQFFAFVKMGRNQVRREIAEKGLKAANESKKRKVDVARSSDANLDKRLRKWGRK